MTRGSQRKDAGPRRRGLDTSAPPACGRGWEARGRGEEGWTRRGLQQQQKQQQQRRRRRACKPHLGEGLHVIDVFDIGMHLAAEESDQDEELGHPLDEAPVDVTALAELVHQREHVLHDVGLGILCEEHLAELQQARRGARAEHARLREGRDAPLCEAVQLVQRGEDAPQPAHKNLVLVPVLDKLREQHFARGGLQFREHALPAVRRGKRGQRSKGQVGAYGGVGRGGGAGL